MAGCCFSIFCCFWSALRTQILYGVEKLNTMPGNETGRVFTDTLKEAAGEQWDRVVFHKFTSEIAHGTIDRNGE